MTPTKSGYTFTKWSITGTASTGFPIEITELDENIKITAQWKKKSSGGGGGGGSSSKEYNIKLKNDNENGKIDIASLTSKPDKTVTLFIAPSEGYELEWISVRDKKGNELALKKKNGTEYTFVMPSSNVEVNFDFVKIEIEEVNKKDDEKDEVEQESIYPQKVVTLTLNQKEAEVFGQIIENDVAPMLKNDRIVLPARFVLEALGAKVDWNNDQKRVIITKGNLSIQIVIDSNEALVDKKIEILDVPAFVENGRTYLPIRFIVENLGAQVIWNNETKQVNIFN